MDARVKLPALHVGQAQIKRERKRFNVIDCGRRFGKNILLHDFAAEMALAGKPVGWGAPIYKQTLDDWRELEHLLTPAIAKKSISELRMELITGGVIEFWSLDKPDSIRGKKYARFIVNEAGLVPRLIDDWNYIIAPTLIDYRGDFYAAGTPKGRNGFWQLYNMTDADWQAWQMSSYTNPHVPAEELDRLRKTMTERAFAQEILAQFLDDGGGVFRRVLESATAQAQDGAWEGHEYVIGVDWGRTADATVFAVVDVTERALVYLDRMTDTDYDSQRLRLRALSERFGNPPVIAESNSIGLPNIERLQNMGLAVQAFTTTNASKSEAIQMLELAFESGGIRLINDTVLLAELMAYEAERLPSGLVRYGAPSGAHDDCVMALALAWWGARDSGDILAWEM